MQPASPLPFLHAHVRTDEPDRTAAWWVEAFGVTIVDAATRNTGDRFVKSVTDNGVSVFFSGRQTGELLAAASVETRFGLDHIAFGTRAMDDDVERLTTIGARLIEGPIALADGRQIAYLETPEGTKVELVSLS